MICSTCSKLAILHGKRKCNRCQSDVFVNLAILCEICSFNDKSCSICLKKIQNAITSSAGCGCGKK